LIQGKILSYGDNLSEAFYIRKKVFCEEFSFSEEDESDEYDQEAMHVVVYDGSDSTKAVATGRIIYYGDSCEIDKVAVLKEYRGLYFGDFTVKMLINKAFTAGVHEVFVRTPMNCELFFNKIGFQKETDYLQNNVICCKMVIRDNQVKKSCNSCSH